MADPAGVRETPGLLPSPFSWPFLCQTAIKRNNPRKFLRSVGDGETVEFDVVEGEKVRAGARLGRPSRGPPSSGQLAQAVEWSGTVLSPGWLGPSPDVLEPFMTSRLLCHAPSTSSGFYRSLEPALFLPNPRLQGPIAATWEGRVREGPFLEASTGRPRPLEEGRRPQPGGAAGQMGGGFTWEEGK